MKASVKVMRSYDYCHFEVTLSNDEELSLKGINQMRIKAAKLADRAVDDYKKMKEFAQNSWEREELKRKAEIVVQNYPKSEWTPEQQAAVKAWEDFQHKEQHGYYDETYDPEEDEDWL